jgi:excisionase family DNA binding protein
MEANGPVAETTGSHEAPSMQHLPKCISIIEAAKALSVSRSKVFELVGSGELLSIKIGRRKVIPIAGLQEFIDRAVATSSSAAPLHGASS